MSYASKVGIVLLKSDFIRMLEEANKQPEKTKLDIDMIFANSTVTTYMAKDLEYIRIFTKWIKWYENDSLYPGVDFIMDFIDHHKHDYIRFGEEFGDCDDHYDFYHICAEVDFGISDACVREKKLVPRYLSDRYKQKQE